MRVFVCDCVCACGQKRVSDSPELVLQVVVRVFKNESVYYQSFSMQNVLIIHFLLSLLFPDLSHPTQIHTVSLSSSFQKKNQEKLRKQ